MCVTIIKPNKLKQWNKVSKQYNDIGKDLSEAYRIKWYWETIRKHAIKPERREYADDMIAIIDEQIYEGFKKQRKAYQAMKYYEIRIG